MNIFKNKVRLEDKEILADYFSGFNYECSGASFSSLYMWRNINNFTWEVIGDYLCIEGLSHLELENNMEVHFMMPPMTRTGEYDIESLRETIMESRRKFEEAGLVFTMRLIPGTMLQIIEDACPEMIIEDDRANYDYVYETSRLAEYKGRKLHSKKNHLNYFKKHYQYECREMAPEMVDDILAFVRAFNRHKDVPEHEMKMLLMEEEAMRDVFVNMRRLELRGCVILIDGKIEALALGGMLDENTIVEHIEKANTAYRGLYQLVLSEFCRAIRDDVEFINREEDMDIENLRAMKLSYRPLRLVDKYIGTINS